jgi:DNA invertase Pin-like site-specific DNA recombinase
MKPITERPGVERIIPASTGRKRKYESTVTTYEAPRRGLQPVGVTMRLSQAKNAEQLQMDTWERQDVTAEVEALGNVYVHKIYCDPDHSGSKREVERPALNLQIAELAAGITKGMAVLDIDRVTRLSGVLERICDIYETMPGLFWYCDDPEVDLRTPEGRNVARERIIQANRESLKMGLRVGRRQRQSKKLGVMVGARGYGYTTTGQVIPREAETIQRLADAVEAGANMAEVFRQLEREDRRPKRGGTWSHRQVADILRSPRVVGRRVDGNVHRYAWAVDASGEPVQGSQPEILELGQWERIRKLYESKERDGRNRSHLGTGLLRCRSCGSRINGGMDNQLGRSRYMCQSRPTVDPETGERIPTCKSRAHVHGPKTDDYIRRITTRQLQKAKPRAKALPWPDAGKLKRYEAERAENEQAWKTGQCEDDEYLANQKMLNALIAKLKRQQREWLASHPEPTGAADSAILERWLKALADNNVREQQAVIAQVWEVIWVEPATEGQNGGKESNWSQARFQPKPKS